MSGIASILKVKNLTKKFGVGCPLCHKSTGVEYNSNVCSHCGTVVACSNVSFELYSNEILGIVGESGSGKSTLVRLMNFDWEATSGEIYIDDTELISRNEEYHEKNLLSLTSFEKRRLKNSIMGTVYQNPYLGLRMDVSSGGNVAEKLITAEWRNVQKMRKRASELFNKTEIPPERMDEPPSNFSGGMQQRVQIAKAMSNNPRILFLDEVTTGLDLSAQARVLDLIRNLQREFHVSMIVVSHDLGIIRLLASRTMVMKSGRVVESGLTDQILEDPQHPYTQLLVNSRL